MNITEVKIRKVFKQPRIKALVSITIDGDLAVHNLKVIQGQDRLFVAMPSQQDGPGDYRDIVHPISKEARKQIEAAVLNDYFACISEHPQEE